MAFVFRDHSRKGTSLLALDLQIQFEKYENVIVYPVNHRLFKIKDEILRHPDFHVFIDEFLVEDGKDQVEKLNEFIALVPEDKVFWVTISGYRR